MRVLMVTNMYPHHEDASFGTFVHEQVRALRGLGVEVDVLFINGRRTQLNYLGGYPRLWRQLNHVRYDLIHAHYVFSGLVARAQCRLPLVLSLHAPGQMETYQGWLCKRLAPHVDAVIVTSPDHKQRLGYEPAQIIPCGVDFDLFRPMDRARARERVGWSQEGKVLAWIGDRRVEKRVDLAYATGKTLQGMRDDVRLEVVSKVPHERISDYMNAADALLLTSDHEGSPVVIKEAMACNLPIVSTDVGDVAQVIEGVAGCYLSSQDPQEMARQAAKALDLGQRTNGREAIAHLSTRSEAERIVSLYQAVLAKRKEAR